MTEIYTDGSCLGNPGPGGWGVVIMEDGKVIDALQGREESTTNNRMEMEAILQAIDNGCPFNEKFYIGEFPGPAIIYTDSAYCFNSFTNWIHTWKKNGWVRSKGQKLENLDLIQEFDHISQYAAFELRKVRGHSGELGNELADALATGKLTAKEVMYRYGK